MDNKVRRSIEIPEDLYEDIKKLAAEEMRSVNKQIVHLLADIVDRKKAKVKLVVLSEPEAKN